MPDGDRFERKLRGKGWRSVYRLGCSGAPLDAVADKVMGAVTHVFRTESTDCLSRIFSKLLETIDLLRNSLFRGSLSNPAFEGLSHEIQEIQRDEGFSEMSRIAERAALRTFNEIELSGEIPIEDVVAQKMTENFVSLLLERHCLGDIHWKFQAWRTWIQTDISKTGNPRLSYRAGTIYEAYVRWTGKYSGSRIASVCRIPGRL